jgi:hypothetical protein
MRDRYTAIGEEEIADAKRADNSAIVKSFRKFLRSQRTLPKGASLQVMKLWHRERIKGGNDAA